MLAGLVFCPQAPLLLPDLAGTAAGELDDVRAACDRALRTVLGTARPERVVLLASDGPGRRRPDAVPPAPARTGDDALRWAPRGAVAPLHGLGMDRAVPLDPADATGPGCLPVGAAVGSVLLGRTGWPGERAAVLLPHGMPAQQCTSAGARLGSGLAADPGPVVLLVLGDASACHGEKAPGHLDDDAEPFDAAMAAALAAADTAALAGLDTARADRLLVAGREAWQTAAAAAATSATSWRGSLLHRSAPYGVGYLVATWLPAVLP